MNKDKVCSTLDNTLHNPNGIIENSNEAISVADHLQEGDNKYDAKNTRKIDISQTEENNIEEYEADVMTGSYGEISLDQEISGIRDDGSSDNKDSQSSKTTEDEKCVTPEKNQELCDELTGEREHHRPNSLLLLKNTIVIPKENEVPLGPSDNAETWKRIHKSQQTSDSQTTSIDGSPSFSSEEFAIYSPCHRRTDSDTSGLSDLQGTITVDGDMVSFVAEDLNEKIKLSSPVSRWTDSPSYPGSRSSTPSLYRQTLQLHVPTIDAGAIIDLEVHARKVATCVDTMLENLSGTLQSISSLTVDYMETYENAVCKTCDSVDTSIKTMYQLMAKCEELGNSMRPLYKISQDIKDIKKTLDHFESVVEHKS